jgi:hypothetical protein
MVKKVISINAVFLLLGLFFFFPHQITIIIGNQCSNEPPSNITVLINGQKVISYQINNPNATNWKGFTILIWGPICSIEVNDKEMGLSSSTVFFVPLGGEIVICPNSNHIGLNYYTHPIGLS